MDVITDVPTLISLLRKSASKKKNRTVDPIIIRSLTLLVEGKFVADDIKKVLPLLINADLSPDLLKFFVRAVEYVPDAKTEILDGLMEQLYRILLGQSMPNKFSAPTEPIVPTGAVPVTNVQLTVLALNALGSFDFQRHVLQMFIKFVSQGYLTNELIEIRQAAIECCVKIVQPFINTYNEILGIQQQKVYNLIRFVLDCLIKVAVSDPVRYYVLKCFHEVDNVFLSHLSQNEALEGMFLALYDEDQSIQETSAALLAKMSEFNPSLIYPRLRRIIKETVYNIANSRIELLEVHSARVIVRLANHAPKFLSPFMNSLLMALMPHLKNRDTKPEVMVCMLEAISSLAVIGGLDVVKNTGLVIPPLVDYVHDSSNPGRREAALLALGDLCQSSAYVVEPYKDHPQLLSTLLSLLRTSSAPEQRPLRRLTMRVLGILGALDPYMHKVYMGTVHSINSKTIALSLPQVPFDFDQKRDDSDIIQWIHYEKCTLAEYYPTLSLVNLMNMMRDSSLSDIYREIGQAVTKIFQSVGTSRSSMFAKQVLRQFVKIAKECKLDHRMFFLRQIGSLAAILRHQLLPFMNELLLFIHEAWLWEEPAEIRRDVLILLHEIAQALGIEFAAFIGDLSPYLLETIKNDSGKEKLLTDACLSCVRAVTPCLSGHIHVILKPILSVVDNREAPEKVRISALETIIHLARFHYVSDRAASLIQTWLRCLSVRYLQEKLMVLLCIVVSQMWTQFLIYSDTVTTALQKHRVDPNLCVEYHDLYRRVKSNPLKLYEDELIPTIRNRIPLVSEINIVPRSNNEGGEAMLSVSVEPLRRHWQSPAFPGRDEWIRWLHNLRLQMLHHSSSPALRECAVVAKRYPPLAKELFNAAFMSIWTQLKEPDQDDVTACIVNAMMSCDAPEVVHSLQNLAEFMDHTEKGPLPVNCKTLSDSANGSHAYAKALRYCELYCLEHAEMNSDDCGSIISLSNDLNLEEAAVGVVRYAEKRNIPVEAEWFEKLGEWEKALDMYRTNRTDDESDDLVYREMQCLESLGCWSELNELCTPSALETGPLSAENTIPQKMAVIAARGCWAVGDYNRMSSFVEKINENSEDGSFLRAVLAIRGGNYPDAVNHIGRARDIADGRLSSLVEESYERGYPSMIMAQQLTELEEAIEYKKIPERRTRITILWSRRLQGCRRSLEYWQRILLVRSLVLSQSELRPMWVKFSSLCRQEGKMNMSRRVLSSLLNIPTEKPLENVIMPVDNGFLGAAICKQLWEDGKRDKAFSNMEIVVARLSRRIQTNDYGGERNFHSLGHLTAKCCLKLGDWNFLLDEAVNHLTSLQGHSKHPYARKKTMRTAPERLHVSMGLAQAVEARTLTTLEHYQNATKFDPKWYKAWHKLGNMYYNLAMTHRHKMFTENQKPGKDAQLSESDNLNIQTGKGRLDSENEVTSPAVLTAVTPWVIAATSSSQRDKNFTLRMAKNAVQSLLRAIRLAEGARVEDTLRLLMVWFDHAEMPEIYEELRNSLKTVPIETWLEVVPQLMSRMDSRKNVGILVRQVVLDVAKTHPQALVYALCAAAKSRNPQRSAVASEILRTISEQRPTLIDHAYLMNSELVRCAILWHEQWHYTLEEASRLYFQERNYEEMMRTLKPVHDLIISGHTTMKEESFNQSYLKELQEAYTHCITYAQTGNAKEMTHAWDIYYKVFKRISSQLRTMASLDLSYISPRLMDARNLEIAVPGTYDPSSPVITVSSVLPHMDVIMSKQRPRKITVLGSDGYEYSFLLKGNEDPRQDERIMQLFGLINHLFLRRTDTIRRNLSIQRYSIITLSHNSGLIGWIPNCDTIHTLIREYREKNRISVSEEHTKMQKIIMDVDKATLFQKIEAFDEALRNTNGDDLRHTLWMKSPNSEVWFDRRTNYTRSMACMSMVGYILGLGDRHPSNLMLDRITGKIIHIDYGDCFEVAMKRVKFPEKIPFRLTRMLVRAMEVTGIEGNYRLTCERVLRMLRDNHDSLLAVLEAFVYDPVLNWRLTDSPSKDHPDVLVGNPDSDEPRKPTGSHIDAISRVNAKLIGKDFSEESVTVEHQVNYLIDQATLYDNLCQCFIGWCPFW